jgi:hypothetical protein
MAQHRRHPLPHMPGWPSGRPGYPHGQRARSPHQAESGRLHAQDGHLAIIGLRPSPASPSHPQRHPWRTHSPPSTRVSGPHARKPHPSPARSTEALGQLGTGGRLGHRLGAGPDHPAHAHRQHRHRRAGFHPSTASVSASSPSRPGPAVPRRPSTLKFPTHRWSPLPSVLGPPSLRDDRDRLLIALAAICCLRVSEVAALRICNI